MKKNLLHLICLLFLGGVSFAQDESFEYQGFSIGQSMPAGANFPRAMMADVIYTGTEYIMYFGFESPTEHFVMYATSPDMNNWTVGDTCLIGSSDPLDREYVLGGARVIKLPSGQYRMFYRASKDYTPGAPDYHIRSAISNDGKVFTREGVVIENSSYAAGSFFKHVGHSEFYYDAGNNLRALLTARDTTMGQEPDNIYTAQSSDGGLSWSNFVMLYEDSHDPVVIEDSSSVFHTYFTYLNTEFHTAKSPDGVGWPATANMLYMIQAGDTITESSSPIYIADLGAGVHADGTIILFSNHSGTPGPWTHIAYWRDPDASLNESLLDSDKIRVFPNPSSGSIHLANLPEGLGNYTVSLLDMSGKEIRKFGTTDILEFGSSVQAGVYLLDIREESGALHCTKRIIIE